MMHEIKEIIMCIHFSVKHIHSVNNTPINKYSCTRSSSSILHREEKKLSNKLNLEIVFTPSIYTRTTMPTRKNPNTVRFVLVKREPAKSTQSDIAIEKFSKINDPTKNNLQPVELAVKREVKDNSSNINSKNVLNISMDSQTQTNIIEQEDSSMIDDSQAQTVEALKKENEELKFENEATLIKIQQLEADNKTFEVVLNEKTVEISELKANINGLEKKLLATRDLLQSSPFQQSSKSRGNKRVTFF